MNTRILCCMFLVAAVSRAGAAESLSQLADQVRATEIAFAQTLADHLRSRHTYM